jgi:hypothetical protein
MTKQKNNNRDNKEDHSNQLLINFDASEKNKEDVKVISLKDYQEKQLEKKIISQIVREGKSF